MQSSPSTRPFKPVLAGASPATDAICSQGVISSARRFAKPEVRGASQRESASFQAPVPQQLQGESDQGLQFNGDHDVTAASRPVKAFVPVRIRLVTPISMGRKLQVILHAKGRSLAMRERPDVSLGRVRIPLWRSPSCGTTCSSIFYHPVVQLR